MYPRTVAIILYGNSNELEGDKNGDLNFYIVHTDPYSQHGRIPLEGVSCNLWVNNLKLTYEYIQLESTNKISSTALIIATGRIVHGEKNQGTIELVNKAKKLACSQLR